MVLVRMSLAGPGRDLRHVVEQRLRGRRADQPQDRDQRDDRREDREDAVVGQRGGPIGEVVLLELPDRARQDAAP